MKLENLKQQIGEATQLLAVAADDYSTGKYDTALANTKLAIASLLTLSLNTDANESNEQKLEIYSTLAHAYNRLNNVFIALSDFPAALEAAEIGIDYCDKTGNAIRKHNLLTNIGIIYASLGEFGKTLEYVESALKFYEAHNEIDGKGECLNLIAQVYAEIGDTAKALDYGQQALAIVEQTGDRASIASILSNCGSVCVTLGDLDKAVNYLEKSISIQTELGSIFSLGGSWGNLSYAYLKRKDFAAALDCLHKAMSVNESTNAKIELAQNLCDIGNIYLQAEFNKQDFAKAEELFREALDISSQFGSKRSLYLIHKHLSDLYKQTERWKEFATHFEAYHNLMLEVKSDETTHRAQQLETRRKIEDAERDRQVKVARFQEQEKILHNILPAQIAEQIVNGEEKIIQRYDNASVLFADVVGFTKLSEGLSLKEVAETLNRIFNLFDELATEFGVEKIKTIGDAYMCVSGLPDPSADHAERMAKMALAMNRHLQLLFPDKRIKLRIGIHCGEVIAGVLGKNKYAYDLWGDTVNTASRMESHGVEDKIQVSKDFRENLDGKFQFEERGEIEVKGKGKMKTYFLTRQ